MESVEFRRLPEKEKKALRARAKAEYAAGKYANRQKQAVAYGVSTTQLWRWFREDDWEGARQEYQEQVCQAAHPVNQKHIQVWEAIGEQVVRRLLDAKSRNVLIDSRTLHALSVTFARVQTGVRTALGMNVPRMGDRSLGGDDLAVFLEKLARDEARAAVLAAQRGDTKGKLVEYELGSMKEKLSEEDLKGMSIADVLPHDPAVEALQVLAQPAKPGAWTSEPATEGSGFSEGVFKTIDAEGAQSNGHARKNGHAK